MNYVLKGRPATVDEAILAGARSDGRAVYLVRLGDEWRTAEVGRGLRCVDLSAETYSGPGPARLAVERRGLLRQLRPTTAKALLVVRCGRWSEDGSDAFLLAVEGDKRPRWCFGRVLKGRLVTTKAAYQGRNAALDDAERLGVEAR